MRRYTATSLAALEAGSGGDGLGITCPGGKELDTGSASGCRGVAGARGALGSGDMGGCGGVFLGGGGIVQQIAGSCEAARWDAVSRVGTGMLGGG